LHQTDHAPAFTLRCSAQDAIVISATSDWDRSDLSMAARFNPGREALTTNHPCLSSFYMLDFM
jgi:hypothetical protein